MEERFEGGGGTGRGRKETCFGITASGLLSWIDWFMSPTLRDILRSDANVHAGPADHPGQAGPVPLSGQAGRRNYDVCDNPSLQPHPRPQRAPWATRFTENLRRDL